MLKSSIECTIVMEPSSGMDVKVKHIVSELSFVTSRSSGPGGQNVNKVNTKVTLLFDVKNSSSLSDAQKRTILEKLSSRINKEGILSISAQNKRSQLLNKEVALKKLDKLLGKAFAIKKLRKATKPSQAAVNKRLEEKKRHSEKKRLRKGLE